METLCGHFLFSYALLEGLIHLKSLGWLYGMRQVKLLIDPTIANPSSTKIVMLDFGSLCRLAILTPALFLATFITTSRQNSGILRADVRKPPHVISRYKYY